MSLGGFVILALLVAGYVALDGYDLGVGILHYALGRSRAERRHSFTAIGPFWNGNEVLLIAAGAALFALFPRAYAVAFSGFYLPFVVLLWLLMVRGMSIELRDHVESDLWRDFWDAAFFVSSLLLAAVLGLALGNLLRGVPLNRAGYFTGTFAFLLNPYAGAVAIFAILAMAIHGAHFAAWRGAQEAGRRAARGLWIPCGLVYAGVTAWTAIVHPAGGALLWTTALLTGAAFAATLARKPAHAFAASTVWLFGLVGCAAETLFPQLIPAFPSGPGIDISNAGPGVYGERAAVIFLAVGAAAALVYATTAARRLLSARRAPGR